MELDKCVKTFSFYRKHLFRLITFYFSFLALFLFSAVVASVAPATAVSPHSLPASTVRFAAIGDFGLAGANEQAVANLVQSWQPDFIITLGDNNYPHGEADTIDNNIGQYYHNYIYPYVGNYGNGADINRFFPSLGNHDWGTDNVQAHLDYFTLPGNERYYDFIWGPIHFFVIDSDGREPDGITDGSVQKNWLQTVLPASTSPWKIVYFHHPPYSSGPHGSLELMRWPFQEWGADAVLSGHEHYYERLSANGLPYFINGLGGTTNIYEFEEIIPESVVQYNGMHGAMQIEASLTTMTFQFINVNNEVIDTLVLFSGLSIETTYLPLVQH